ncbi:MAG: (4Fe-4S)-binding protein [Oscillospiraceae bacterium]|jgi:epoxyqueuosine reductase QueG|nr:(4Fe-4S)-binding protein [Oscillospiraceae bacterium]
MLTSALLKEAAKDWGADLLGVGSIERWDSAPAENDPRAIMPGAKSVICIGFRIHRGSHRGVEEGTYFSSYTLTGFADLNNIIAPTVQRKAASFIEDYGYEAATVMYHANRFGGGKYNTGRAALREDGTEKPKPDILFNFRIGAVLCGVGQIGHNRLLLTPQFGPSQRVYFIVTDAPLEPDPIITEPLCDGCLECVRKCPAKALSAAEFDNVEVTGVTSIKRCAIDTGKCTVGHYGGVSPFTPAEVLAYSKNIVDGTATTCADGTARPPDAEIVDYLEKNVTYTKSAYDFTYGPAVVCASCIRSCLAHLEKVGRVQKKRV